MIKMTSAAQRVLIVADACRDVTPIIAPLRDAGCFVQLATNVQRAVELAAALNPTIVIVGGTGGDANTVELTMRLRSAVPPDVIPLFIMAPSCEALARDRAADGDAAACDDSLQAISAIVRQIGALMNQGRQSYSGADAVQGSLVTKPVVTPAASEASRVQCNGVSLDRVRHRAWLDGDELHLTPTEFKLLWELAGHPGFVLSRDELARACKGSADSVQSRTIDAHIKAIRRKLGDKSLLVETVHGVGYRFRDQQW